MWLYLERHRGRKIQDMLRDVGRVGWGLEEGNK